MKKNLVIILAAALIFFLLGCFVGFKLTRGQAASQGDTYQAGWEAAKKRLTETGFIPPVVKHKTLYGQIKEIGDNQVVIKVRSLEPLADSNLDERIVKIDANTKFYFLEMKHEEEREVIMEKMQKTIQEMKNPTSTDQNQTLNISAPDSFFNKIAAGFSDMKVGNRLNVVAVDDDVRETKSFIASEILIQPAGCENPTCQTSIH